MENTTGVRLSDSLEISRLVHGHWRLAEWGLDKKETLSLVESLIDWGITTFDHADIYGDYSCERLFGEAIGLKPSIRNDIRIVTKCGIKLMSGHYPYRRIKSYDYSYEHILGAVDGSLRNLGTDRIDLLLFHRPAPFFDPSEVSKAMDVLHRSGKVLNFGVSNFSPLQFEMLQKHTGLRLVTNQVELSPYCLEHFDNGNIDFFLKEGIRPMAWSPLAGGKIFRHVDEKSVRLLDEIRIVSDELGAKEPEEVIYAWLLMHPAGIIPVIGSGKRDRIRYAVNAFGLKMDTEQWYRIYNASRGSDLA